MLALEFLFPALLWAAGAAAAPVIIHLILRTKPRRIVFPAMRFVKKTHQANLSKLRLKHLILLAMRMAIIALIVVLIARTVLPSWQAVSSPRTPVAAVLVVDNTGSMSAKDGAQNVFAKAKLLANQLIEQLPEGSKIAIMEAADPAGKANFVADRKLAVQQVAEVPQTYSQASLWPALTRAAALLEKSDMSPKEVYVLTDMTAHAWRDGAPMKAYGLNFIVVDCGLGKDTNLALGELMLSGATVPMGVDVPLETTVFGAHAGGDVAVQVDMGAGPVDQKTLKITPGMPAAVKLSARVEKEGVVAGKVTLQGSDLLEMDNTRFFSLQVGPLPKVLMVTDLATDETFFLMSNAISPPGAAATGRSWVDAQTTRPDQLDAKALATARVVLLADVAALSETQWGQLADYVRGGGNLWIVGGPRVTVQSYNAPAAQKLMPAAIKSLEATPAGVAWKAARAGEPTLEPFLDADNPPLTDVACLGRFALDSSAPDARVVLAYQDGAPAILSRAGGEGEVVFWNFCPAAEYFRKTGLTQFAILAQCTVRLLSGSAGDKAAYTWGQDVTLPLPKGLQNVVVTVRRPGSESEQPVLPDFRRRLVTIKADALGSWLVRFAEGDKKVERVFAVNADPKESDLAPQDVRPLEQFFAAGKMKIVKEVNQIGRDRQAISKSLDLSVPVLLALLVLMMAEAFFANRFYKTPAPPQ